MSKTGMSLAVAPGTRSEPEPNKLESNNIIKYKASSKSSTGITGSMRVIEVQLVAFIMVLSVSGLVPLADLLFPAFASTYIIALSRLAFPPRARAGAGDVDDGSTLFGAYVVVVGTTVGLVLPLAYVLGGFARGDEQAVRSATPHLFLLSFQILTENIISGTGLSYLFSPPVRAMVPLLYTIRMMFVLLHWTQHVWLNVNIKDKHKDSGWVWFGRALAVANLAYFSINLLCFLIPTSLPRAFKNYYYFNQIRDHEIHMKNVNDSNRFSSSAPTPDNNKKDD